MTYWMAKASKLEAKQKFILVDKASHRHKFDNKLKEDATHNVSRIRADIQDLVIDQIPQIKDTPVSKLYSNCVFNAAQLYFFFCKNKRLL